MDYWHAGTEPISKSSFSAQKDFVNYNDSKYVLNQCMSRKIIILIFIFLYTNCNIQIWGQEIAIKTYTANDGLVANPVRRIYQDSKGFIWIVTWEGISKYDGHKFTNYNTANGLTHELVNDVREINGKMYVAQNNGVVDVIQNESVVPQPITANLVVNKFHAVTGSPGLRHWSNIR